MVNEKPPIALEISKLRDLVIRLRAPDGCPWDREQTLADLRAYLLEEAHEAAAAIDERDWVELAEELGDLLFQIVFAAGLAEESGHFDLAHVIESVNDKMIARHPHVFGDHSDREMPRNADEVRGAWERGKLAARTDRSLLQGVPSSLPALTAAYRITQKAASVGFDWPDARAVLAKIHEELAEVEEVIGALPGSRSPQEKDKVAAADLDAAREEIGDLLFTIASFARHLEIDPEAALAQGNRKFRKRFRAIEQNLESQGRSLAEQTPAELEAEWQVVKSEEAQHREK